MNQQTEIDEKLIEIDKNLTEQIKVLKEYINQDYFQFLCEFKKDELDELNEIDFKQTKLQNARGIKGIYLFEIYKTETSNYENWANEFKYRFRGNQKGDDERNGLYLKKWTPNIVNKRLQKHIENTDEWIPLYIGKSANISERIISHLYSKLGKPPSALKIKERKNLKDERLRIQYIPFPSEIKEYETAATVLESALRKKINPISGK